MGCRRLPASATIRLRLAAPHRRGLLPLLRLCLLPLLCSASPGKGGRGQPSTLPALQAGRMQAQAGMTCSSAACKQEKPSLPSMQRAPNNTHHPRPHLSPSSRRRPSSLRGQSRTKSLNSGRLMPRRLRLYGLLALTTQLK